MDAPVLAVFGGSFNPPHVGHVLACALVLAWDPAARLIVVPTYKHPLGKPLAPFADRLRMCELGMGWLPGVAISDLEREIGGESFTLRTLEHLASRHPGTPLRLVVGADILAEAHRWYAFDVIEKMAPPLVLGRAGTPGVRALLPEISSTEVRDAIARGAWDEVQPTLPGPVLDYIRTTGLYATEP